MAEKECFVIAPIGDPDTDVRKRSDQVLKHVISPALKELGYRTTRADHISEPGMITSQVIQHIVDDPLVVADLTDRNPNVFYELALRHAIRKPLIQLIKKGEQIPFDVAGTRTIHVDHQDLDSVEEAKKEIIAQVRHLEKNPSSMETPISVSLDLQLLKQSSNPEQRSLADVLSGLSELRNAVLVLEKKLSNPESLLPKEFLNYLVARTRHSGSTEIVLEARSVLEKLISLLSSLEGPIDASERDKLGMRVLRLREELDHMAHRY